MFLYIGSRSNAFIWFEPFEYLIWRDIPRVRAHLGPPCAVLEYGQGVWT